MQEQNAFVADLLLNAIFSIFNGNVTNVGHLIMGNRS